MELFFLAGPAHAISPADRVQFADGLYARGLYDLAVKEYLPLLTNQPPVTNLDAVLFRAAESFRYLSDKKSAAMTYEQLVQGFPGSKYSWRAEFRRAELQATGGEYLEAVNKFRVLIDKNPPADIAASALYYLGYSQARLNLKEDAQAAYRRVVKEYSESPFFSYACLGLAEIGKQTGAQEDELRGLYEKATRQPATPRVGAEAWFQLGDLAFRARDYAASANAYEQLLTRYPSDERANEARLPAGWSLHNVKRHADALKIAESALKRSLDSDEKQEAEWHYLKANCLRQLRQNAEATETYKHILKEHADSPLAAASSYEAALIAFGEQNYAGVVAMGARVDESGEYAKDFHWMLAESQVALTNADAAIAQYKVIAEKYPESDRAAPALFQHARLMQDRAAWSEAAGLYRQAAAKSSELAADALFASAHAWNKLKNSGESLRDLTELAEKHSGFKKLDAALFQKAQAELELTKTEDARATLDRLIKDFPKSETIGNAHYLMGVLLEKAENYDVAQFHYQAALAKNEGGKLADEIQFRRASVLQRQGKNDEAAGLLQGLLATPARSEMPDPLIEWLARYNLQAEKYLEADAAATALAAHTKDPTWKQIAWYLAGRARQVLGKPVEARQAYELALEVDAKTREGVEAALYLGQVGLDASDYVVAEKYYSKAAEMASTDELLDIRARSYFGLGETARAQQKWEDAARYFMSVGVLFDNVELTPRALYYAAEAFGKQGRDAERDNTLTELKQRYPDSEWAKK